MARDDPSDGMAPAKEKEARSRKIPKGLHYPLREAKKQWQTGRTIISYYQSLAGNLLRYQQSARHYPATSLPTTSRPTLYPTTLAPLPHLPFSNSHRHSPTRYTNDDLVGFFNSVPQHRLIDAVHSLIQHWQTQHTTHTLTADTKATGNPYHHSHIGRHHARHPTQRTIHTSDIATIVASALNTCIFRACNHTYKQIRGAGTGSQLSPALCNVAITLIEHSWQQLHNNLLRHTDLHFTSIFPFSPSHPTLIHHNFFGDPVELETVDDFHLLGFNIDLNQRTISYTQPTQSWEIRDATSAGSKRLTLSGLASRLHTIYTYTYPLSTQCSGPASQPLCPQQTCSNRLQEIFEAKKERHVFLLAPGPASCVCPPLFLRVCFCFHRTCRGMERTCEAPSNEAPHMILGYRQGRLPTYLQSTVAHAVPLSVCFMVVFARYSHQTGFPQLLSAAVVQPRFCGQVNNLFNISVALTFAPCVSLIPFCVEQR